MRTVREYIFVSVFGSVAYGFMEIVYRGRTHWSMMLIGGAAFLFIYCINEKLQPSGRLLRCLLGCVLITCIEFLVGCVVNRWFRMGVWDYSGLPLNLMGQICPSFSGLWFLLCIPGDCLCGYMHRVLFASNAEDHPAK